MASAKGEYDLERFLEAQAGVYERACAELRAGMKQSHWMWFIFPQIHGLGSSEMAVRYAISSIEEAHAYLEHPVLGQRIRECTSIVIALEGRTAEQIFGYPDNLKFHSSMTLFAQAATISEEDLIFSQALDKYFSGREDPGTVQRL
ncbi:DUF1810 domain-containing protein [Edaphobacter modestus]|uniref:Uncharacterized protein (DUF1810 family) n=1 Tax=Edaphobacter modestus TaxID=388466 RepID=A0A4Q7YXS1_9BACT|nr:DUF1810 domain-containing protein [Edaphobacter modestus]RZU42011.1 uncharacterized protein (DUF1810 family) [Edaphobacter modestus]